MTVPEDPSLASAYRRLVDARTDVEIREIHHDASSRSMLANALIESQVELDGARDRLHEEVRDARRLGMAWCTIASALQITEEEAQERYGTVDRPNQPGGPGGPIQYEW